MICVFYDVNFPWLNKLGALIFFRVDLDLKEMRGPVKRFYTTITKSELLHIRNQPNIYFIGPGLY